MTYGRVHAIKNSICVQFLCTLNPIHFFFAHLDIGECECSESMQNDWDQRQVLIQLMKRSNPQSFEEFRLVLQQALILEVINLSGTCGASPTPPPLT